MKKIAMLALVVGIGAVLAGCGSSGGSHGAMGSMTGSGGTEKNAAVVPGAPVIFVTSKAYGFAPKQIRVSAGTDVTLALTTSDLPHDITVEGIGHIAHASGTKVARGGLKIMKPGNYVFYCSVKGHRAQGMTGTIIAS